MAHRSAHLSKSWRIRLIQLISLIAISIGMTGALTAAPVSAAGPYIDPINSPKIGGIPSSVTSIAGLSDDKIALFYGAYDAWPAPALRVLRFDGSLVFDANLTDAFGSRAANSMSFFLNPLADGSTVITVEGTAGGCELNTNNPVAFLRVDASGHLATALTSVSAVIREYNCYTQVAELSNGNLAFLYQTTGQDYVVRIFQPNGAPLTAETSIIGPTCAGESVYDNRIAANKNGAFLVTYHCNNHTGLYGRLYDNNGSPLADGGAEFTIGTFPANTAINLSVTALSDNTFMVAYKDISGYVFKKISPTGAVSSAGSYAGVGSGVSIYPYYFPYFQALPDGGFAAFDVRSQANGSYSERYSQAYRYSNSGALLEGPTDLDTTYYDRCALPSGSPCDSSSDWNSWSTFAVGYNQGILYLNGRSQTLTLHSFIATLAPRVTTGAVSALTPTGATLNGAVNANNNSATVTFQYGPTAAYGNTAVAVQTPVGGASDTPVSAMIYSLTPNTTYHFRVVAVNAGGTTNGSDQTFTTPAAPPSATTVAASAVTASGATLNGAVNANNANTAVAFEYGLTASYGTTVTASPSVAAGTSSTPVSAAITGLIPNVTYHFRVQAVNAGGKTYGADQTFTTSAVAPAAATGAASGLTASGATLNGAVSPNNASTTVTFEYGPTASYGSTATAAQSPINGMSSTAVSAVISGLTPNTTYHYRVVAVNAAGGANGADGTFSTAALPPSVTSAAASAISATGATLNGAVNANYASSTVTFEYGPTASYGSAVSASQSPVSGSSDTAVSAVLTGLTPNATYHFRVVAVNAGGTTTGADGTFTTLAAAPNAITSAASDVSTTGATLNGAVNANNTSTTVTFEYGLTASYGSTVTAGQSPLTGTASTPVSAAVSGLTPNTTYHFRVAAANTAGAVSGADQTFTTPAAAPVAQAGAPSPVTTTQATLRGSVSANNADTTVTFEYGQTTGYGSTVAAESPLTGMSDTPVSAAVNGLTPNTTYHFRVKAVNAAGETNSPDQTFTTAAAAPLAITAAAGAVTFTGATLYGTVNANNASTTVTFEYGPTASYGSSLSASSSPVSGIADTAVSAALTGLMPNTTYHFRVKAVSAGGTVYGADDTFDTPAAAPTVTSGAASGLSMTGATLNGTINANNASATVTFEYGLTSTYGNTVTAAESPVSGMKDTPVSAALAGLTPNTTYHFRVVAVNAGGATHGPDQTFSTLPAAPTATTYIPGDVTLSSATLLGAVDANGAETTVTFEYGTTTGYGSSVTAAESPLTGAGGVVVSAALSGLLPDATDHYRVVVSAVVSGLLPGTAYHYRVVATSAGGTIYGLDQTFTTGEYRYLCPVIMN